jgi:hypothetical protein
VLHHCPDFLLPLHLAAAGVPLPVCLFLPYCCLQLEHLDLSCNLLSELPASIGSLGRTLRKLDVSENSLGFLPEGLGGLTQLRSLRASNNVLTELPDSLAQLQVGVYMYCAYVWLRLLYSCNLSTVGVLIVLSWPEYRLMSVWPVFMHEGLLAMYSCSVFGR